MTYSPVYTKLIDGSPVRFFRAPGEKADFPYHAVDNLHAALKLPRALRRESKSNLGKSQWRDDIKITVYEGERVLIALHVMAQGVIGSIVEQGYAHPSKLARLQ